MLKEHFLHSNIPLPDFSDDLVGLQLNVKVVPPYLLWVILKSNLSPKVNKIIIKVRIRFLYFR